MSRNQEMNGAVESTLGSRHLQKNLEEGIPWHSVAKTQGAVACSDVEGDCKLSDGKPATPRLRM